MLEREAIYAAKYKDRFPSIKSAGKLIPTGERAETCLKEITPRPVTPPVVKKFLNTTRPDPGAVRVFYGKAGDPDVASSLVHGVSTRPSLTAALLTNPSPKTLFQQKLQELREAAYSSHQKAPLGRTCNQPLGLPNGMDIEKTTFGSKTLQSVNAGEIIHPPKSHEQVEKELQEGHHLYIRSHNAYFVGEPVNRKYDWTKYSKSSRFGIATPHYNDGRNVAKSLQWLHHLQMERGAKLVTKQSDDFRERTQPQIGKVNDPIADTMNVPLNHTYGIMVRPDEFGVGYLLHHTASLDFLRGKDRKIAILNAVRQHLKKANFHNFSSLLEAFRHYDKKGNGVICKEDLQDVCRQFNLDLHPQLLETLIAFCDYDNDGRINFLEFSNFLNWKDKMPIGELEEKILTKGRNKADSAPPHSQKTLKEGIREEALAKEGDLVPAEGGIVKTPKTLPRPKTVPDNYTTSSSMVNAVVGGLSTVGYRVYGVPAVRTDLAAPRIKRVSDRTNYGDQSNAGGLIHPSLYSLKGVHEKDFFISRPKEEIACIFRNVGMDISEETFHEVWNLAAMKHPRGQVCVETFRNVLDEIQAK
ncbi:EF-hand domain-containing family member B [Lepisosteus oculatus]|uniref:EF-hand domain-containing family member B n=1 Tax=Lepisosteus oculatus TaxID=7918 RepID=UPI0035F50410